VEESRLKKAYPHLEGKVFKEGGHYNRSIVDLLLKEKIKLF
jgi:hypothetical protein